MMCAFEIVQCKHCTVSVCLHLCPVDSSFILFLRVAVRDRWGQKESERGREREKRGWGWDRERLLDLGVVGAGLSKDSSLFSLKCVCECEQDFGSCPDVVAQLKSPDKRHFLKFGDVCVCVCVCGFALWCWLNALPAG